MSKHEIRLRKQRMARGSDRYRDFDALMEKHAQGMRLKKLFNAMIIILVLVIMTVLLIAFVYFRHNPAKPATGTAKVPATIKTIAIILTPSQSPWARCSLQNLPPKNDTYQVLK